MANTTVYPFGQNGQLPSGYPIVNDLTTGGADKALSAEMGKVLNGGAAEDETVDLSGLTKYSYGISNQNKWVAANGTTNKSKCVLADIQNYRYIKVEAVGGDATIAFLNTAVIEDGSTPDFSATYNGRFVVAEDDEVTYEIPADAKLLYCVAQISDGTPVLSRYNITGTTIDTTLLRKNGVVDNLESEATDAPLSANQGRVLNEALAEIKAGGSGYRINPITTFGESRNGTITTVYTSEYTILDVEKYRGCNIFVHNVHSSNGCSQIKDGSNVALATYSGENTSVGAVYIPNTAKTFVISNDLTKNPDFHIKVPEDKVRKNGLVFGENFLSDYDAGDFSQFNGTVTSGYGLVLPGTGESNGLIVDRVIALDNWSLVADVLTADNTEVVNLGTKITQTTSANHSTRVEIDFGNGTIKLYNNATNTLVETGDISSIVSDNIYTVKLERINRAIKATLINRTTGASVYVDSPDGSEGSGNEGLNPAGKMFDQPVYYVGSGTPYLQNIYATCIRRAKVLFVGDSITQGAHTTWETSWAPMAAEYFGNSITGGRGSGGVMCCLNQLRSLIPVIAPKAVVVTIGTNYESSISSDGYTGLYKSILNLILAYGAIPILNNTPACNARKTGLTILNGIIDGLKQIGCRFDLATSNNNDWDDGQNNSYYYTDKVHLNAAGNTLLYNIVTSQLGWLKNL